MLALVVERMRLILRIIPVPAAVTLTVLLLPVAAQTPPEVGHLAAQTAKKVARTDARRILTTPLTGCLVVPQLCAELDAALHAELERSISSAQFIPREEALKHLADHGFLSIDAYLGALDDVARDAGAEVVIGESFRRKHNECSLHTTVTDTKHRFALAEFDVRTSCLATQLTASLLKDSETGAFLFVPAMQGVRAPSCVNCPAPHYAGDTLKRPIQGFVQLLITVTEQGTVENARVLSAVEEGFALASLRTVNGWHFKPAVRADGVPFSARVMVALSFSLSLHRGPDKVWGTGPN
jgi:TonB family protein